MEEWKEYRLGDIIKISSGFPYKSEYLGNGDNFLLGMGCVSFNEQFLDKGMRPYSGECDERYYVNAGDIILATRQQSDNMPILGMPAIIPHKHKGKKIIVGSNLYKVTNKSKDFSNDFIYWILKSSDYINYIKSCQTGTTVRMITKTDIENYTFISPSKDYRLLINRFLWNFENKIELNRRINENLEQQAQTLFKSWFVDFEPFKDGKFVDSELGRIPEGWSINLVKDIAIFTQGTQVPISMQYNTQKENMIRFIRIVDYTSNNTELPRFIYKTSKQTECDESDVIMVRYGNIGTIGRRLTGVIANNLFKISPSNILTKNFLYYFFKQKEIQELIVASAAGSAMPAIKHSTIGNINIIVPSKGIVTMFDLICNSYEAQILKNNQENSYLKEVRDTLLPKLMSGELKLGEIGMKLDE